MGTSRAQIVAVFGERDRMRAAAPQRSVLGTLSKGSIRARPWLVLIGAAAGAALAVAAAPVFEWLVNGLAGESRARPVLLAVAAGIAGAALGAWVVRGLAARVESGINAHVRHGRVVTLVAAEPGEATATLRKLEREGALEATLLPRGFALEGHGAPAAAPLQGHGGGAFGATLVAGHPALLKLAPSLEADGLRLEFLERDGHAGPIHSSTAGPGWVTGPDVEAGDGWGCALEARYGRPIRVRLADGELVLSGNERRLVLVIAGHRNDTVASALARLEEYLGLPDASARIVSDRIDSGALGLVIFGALETRRRAVELLAESAVASSEGSFGGPEGRGGGTTPDPL